MMRIDTAMIDKLVAAANNLEPHSLEYAWGDGIAFALMAWAHDHNGKEPSGADAQDFLNFAIPFVQHQLDLRHIQGVTLKIEPTAAGPQLHAIINGEVVANAYVDATAHGGRMFGGIEESARIFGTRRPVWAEWKRLDYSRVLDDIVERKELDDMPSLYRFHLFPGDELGPGINS